MGGNINAHDERECFEAVGAKLLNNESIPSHREHMKVTKGLDVLILNLLSCMLFAAFAVTFVVVA